MKKQWYVHWDEDEQEGSWLSDVSPEEACCEGRPAIKNDITSATMAEWLDRQAENENRHDLVGCYTWIADQLRKLASEKVAEKLMHRIAEAGCLSMVSRR